VISLNLKRRHLSESQRPDRPLCSSNLEEGIHPDEQFGKWVADNRLSQLATDEVNRDERAAAMWAAA
jgi:hypothetical protein